MSHEGPSAVGPHQPTLGHELVKGLAHRDAADAEAFTELALGRELGLGGPDPRVDQSCDLYSELVVKGDGAASIQHLGVCRLHSLKL